MQYQVDVTLISASRSYAIYLNGFYNGVARQAPKFTLIPGGYDSLNLLPYYGFNIANLSTVFSSDLTSATLPTVLNQTSLIILQNGQGLTDLALLSPAVRREAFLPSVHGRKPPKP